MPHLDERQRRVVCSAMAQAVGRGGSARVVEATGISTATMSRAMRELREGFEVTGRQRAPGGGKKPAEEAQPGLLEALDELVHPATRGNPMSPLGWTLKSTRTLAAELAEKGFRISQETVRHKLAMLGYSLQGTAKQNEGSQHPDRDAQFRYLNDTSAGFLDAGDPVISVDTKKKELIGGYSNGGREWQPAGEPERTDVHDFPDPALGEYAKAIPYGVFDLANNEGWVSVGDTADTAEFAVESIRRWWQRHGQARFGDTRRLLITADAGGSNGYRVRAWKKHLAELATETGLEITVCHYPPGTSKWNKIEHRLFSFISMNWRGRPLTDLRTIIELISNTTTTTGLVVHADHDPNWYPKGVKITDREFNALPIHRHDFHGDWNYTITPTNRAT
ncbi:MAG: ISAzo13 family transposase [Acidimicrobiales bacterium]